MRRVQIFSPSRAQQLKQDVANGRSSKRKPLSPLVGNFKNLSPVKGQEKKIAKKDDRSRGPSLGSQVEDPLDAAFEAYYTKMRSIRSPSSEAEASLSPAARELSLSPKAQKPVASGPQEASPATRQRHFAKFIGLGFDCTVLPQKGEQQRKEESEELTEQPKVVVAPNSVLRQGMRLGGVGEEDDEARELLEQVNALEKANEMLLQQALSADASKEADEEAQMLMEQIRSLEAGNAMLLRQAFDKEKSPRNTDPESKLLIEQILVLEKSNATLLQQALTSWNCEELDDQEAKLMMEQICMLETGNTMLLQEVLHPVGHVDHQDKLLQDWVYKLEAHNSELLQEIVAKQSSPPSQQSAHSSSVRGVSSSARAAWDRKLVQECEERCAQAQMELQACVEARQAALERVLMIEVMNRAGWAWSAQAEHAATCDYFYDERSAACGYYPPQPSTPLHAASMGQGARWAPRGAPHWTRQGHPMPASYRHGHSNLAPYHSHPFALRKVAPYF